MSHEYIFQVVYFLGVRAGDVFVYMVVEEVQHEITETGDKRNLWKEIRNKKR